LVGGGTAALAGGADPAAVAPPSVLAAILGAALLVLVIGRAARTQPRAERPAPPVSDRPSVPSADAGMARLIVLCGRPYQLTGEEAADWLRRDVQRLLEADVVTHAELTQVQPGSAHHPAGCHWMLELHLEDGIDAHGLADAPPCGDWLSELRQLGMQPVVLLADGGTVHCARRR
jgi:hypothetical protein